MRLILALFIAVAAQAQNHLDRHDYVINLEASNFNPPQNGSEYFYEIEIISNYGTLEVATQVGDLLRRATELREEIGSGRFYRVPLAQRFPNSEGGVDQNVLRELTQRLNKKIEGLQKLLELCEVLHSHALYRASSERVRVNAKGKFDNLENVEFPLGDILTMFRVSELVEAVEMVSPLPELNPLPGQPLQQKGDLLGKFKAPSPKLLWTARLLQKDPGSKPRAIQETKAAADIRPNLDSWDYSPLYALIGERNGLTVRASIKREVEAPKASCYRPAVGF